MEGYWKVVAAVGTALSLVAIGIGVATWTLDMKNRLETLENQIKLFATAPAIVRSSGNLESAGTSAPRKQAENTKGTDVYGTDVTYTTIYPNNYTDYPIQNPLVLTCMDLVQRAVKARENNQTTFAASLDQYQKDYGCAQALKGGTLGYTDYAPTSEKKAPSAKGKVDSGGFSGGDYSQPIVPTSRR